MRIIAFVRRLFRRTTADVGLFQIVSPDAEPYVAPHTEDQVADTRAYMERYYRWMQGSDRSGGDPHWYAKGGIIAGPGAKPEGAVDPHPTGYYLGDPARRAAEADRRNRTASP